MTTNLAEKAREDSNNITDISQIGKINSDTFTPTGEKIGFGCWGSVELYTDLGGQKWALKYFSPNETALEQMEERNWTPERVMRQEAVPLEASIHNVVPRIIERDREGKIYVAMPYFREGDLSRKIRYLSLDDALKITRDIADALSYTHDNKIDLSKNDFLGHPIKGQAHADVKPSNILMRNGRAYLSDYGSSTCITMGGNGSNRGAHGDRNYQAPENLIDDPEKETKPSTRADVWSLGAILYETIAGEGIYDGMKDNKINQKAIRKKLRQKIPRKLRKFVGKCLAVEPYNRFRDGKEVLASLEKTIEELDTGRMVKHNLMKRILPITLASGIFGMAFYGVETYEPQKLDMPTTNQVQGILYQPGAQEKNPIEFVAEEIDSLPEARELGMIGEGITKYAKNCTKNRAVAYLAKTHQQAILKNGIVSQDVCTENQYNTYMIYTLPEERRGDGWLGHVWPVVGKSIEVALTQSSTEDGKVDLEDVMAITRVGIDKVNLAKRASGSFDYEVYRNAKYETGKDIIPKEERKFIDTWLAYYHTEID